MPKTGRILGGSDATGQLEPPVRYVTGYSPEFDGPVRCRDDLTVVGDTTFVGDMGFFGKVPVAQEAAITDASVAHALAATYSDTEVEAALDALGTKINAILDVLQAYGLIAT